jgi:hypothetical protein
MLLNGFNMMGAVTLGGLELFSVTFLSPRLRFVTEFSLFNYKPFIMLTATLLTLMKPDDARGDEKTWGPTDLLLPMAGTSCGLE